VLLALLIGAIMPAAAFDFEVPQRSGYSLYFNIVDTEDKTVSVTCPSNTGNNFWQNYTMPSGILNIPASVVYNEENYTVTHINEYAFYGCDKITSVSIPKTITYIGAYAFYQCSGIRGIVTIGEDVTTIGRSAFYGCSSITELHFNAIACDTMGGSRSGTAFASCYSLRKVVFGPKVTMIPDYAFVGMDLLNQEWQMPEALEYIGEYAFGYCSNIRGKLVLPDGVKKVAPFAFTQCHKINHLVLPMGLSRIDSRAFYQCVGINEITARALVPPVLGDNVFEGVKRSIVLNVSCISSDRYAKSEYWKSFYNRRVLQPCTLPLVARSSDPECGKVTGGGTYSVGSKVTLTAICNAGYGFLGWQDGNTDNPRIVTVDDTVSYIAQMARAAIEIEYVHDTVYADGIKIVTEYYEVNDIAEPINTQEYVVYNAKKKRLDYNIDRNEIEDLALYNDAGQCIMTGQPRKKHINMRRFKTGFYVLRITTLDEEKAIRFFHRKK